MRLLWTTRHYRPRMAGSEFYTEGVAVELASRGHEVHILTSTPNGARRIDGDRGVKIWRRRSMRDFAAVCREVKPQVVLTQYEWAAQTLQQAPCPACVVMHNAWSPATISAPVRPSAALWIANSPVTLAASRHHIGDLPACVLVPPLDVERIEVQGIPGVHTCQDAVGIANPIADKGADLFMDVVRAMPSEMFIAQLGGYGIRVPMRERNLDEWTPGPIHELFARLRVLLMPSLHESWGMAAVEAQWNGIPVIASDLPSLRESLGDGAVFLPHDAARWVKEIARLFDDQERFDDLAGRAIMNADRVAALHEAQLDELVERLEAIA